MASIYKRRYQVTKNGKPIIGADGKKLTKLSRFYTIEYTDAEGRPRTRRGYSDKTATAQLAARLEKAAARGEEGMIDPYREHRARPLTEHVADYVAELRTLGRDGMYVYSIERMLKLLCNEAKWQHWPNVTTDSFEAWREREKSRIAENGEPVAPRTLNHYLEMARAFCNWLVKRKRMPANPLLSVEKVQGEAKRKRRAMTDDQIATFLAVAPEARRLVWEVLLSIGLRVQEIADLEWQDVHAEATRPYISLRASKVKSRRDQTAMLRKDLADKLRAVRPADAAMTDRVFPNLPTLEDWKADLAAAGIEYMDATGRQLDRHAARNTLATRLQKASVPIRVAMEILRHSDVRLTTKVYVDPTLFDTSGAVESLPPLMREAPRSRSRRAPMPPARSMDRNARENARTILARRCTSMHFHAPMRRSSTFHK